MIFAEIFFVFAGVIFIGKVWGKIRPMVEIKKDDVTYHAGISHSHKKGMIPLTQQDLLEPRIEIGETSYCGLSNKSQLQLRYGELGKTTPRYDQKLLEANQKLQTKTEVRNKPQK
ncbi:MAG: hypothetical protein AAF518_25420 [Spirochaetota bacterium]